MDTARAFRRGLCGRHRVRLRPPGARRRFLSLLRLHRGRRRLRLDEPRRAANGKPNSMSGTKTPGTAVHLVGSIGLDTVEEVFGTVGQAARAVSAPHSRRRGRRPRACGSAGSIRCCGRIHSCGRTRPARCAPPTGFRCSPWPRASAPPRFASANWATRARRAPPTSISWRRATRASCRAGIRFQVCLPTPFAVVSSVVVEDALAPVEAAYERAMLAEVAALCRHIPHRDLCIQWDLCNEMVIWDGQKTSAVPYPDGAARGAPRRAWRGFAPRAGRCRARPASLLWRFRGPPFRRAERRVGDGRVRQRACPDDRAQARLYPHAGADRAHRRRVPPAVRRACARRRGPNSISAWCMPRMGVEGARARIGAAGRYVPRFGIATECGMARARTEATVRSLLDIHARVCRA